MMDLCITQCTYWTPLGLTATNSKDLSHRLGLTVCLKYFLIGLQRVEWTVQLHSVTYTLHLREQLYNIDPTLHRVHTSIDTCCCKIYMNPVYDKVGCGKCIANISVTNEDGSVQEPNSPGTGMTMSSTYHWKSEKNIGIISVWPIYCPLIFYLPYITL